MGLLGALVGGGIGFMMGGPLGAMIGGALGSQVGGAPFQQDQGGRRAFGRMLGRCPHCSNIVTFQPDISVLICPRCGARLSTAGGAQDYRHERAWGADPRHAAHQVQSAFMVALISLAAKVAKADGHVTQAEVRSFDQFLAHDLGMNAEDRRIAARIFNEARDSDVPASEFARQLRALLGHQPDRMRDLVTLLLKVAHADGRLSPDENRLIRSIASDLGLGQRDMEACLALFQTGDLGSAYALLGVESTAADAEVRKAYRRLAKEYHPDVIAQKGLSDEFQDFAKKKMRAVNAAYDQIKTTRGMK